MQPTRNEPENTRASAPGLASTSRDVGLVVAVVTGALALFVGKAFTIDDPLALWLARHLQTDPLDFFGFTVNWYGTAMPMHEVTMNPPLSGYYLAAAAAAFGWSEVALHTAFLVPAAAAAAATTLLARRLCARPVEAALIGLLTPAFLVSSTNVMCDTTMLAFWCASIWLWIRGLDANDARHLWAAAILAGLAGLAKYFGLALLPLLFVYGLARKRRIGSWCLPLAAPVSLWTLYELATRSLYGSGSVGSAALYAGRYNALSEGFLDPLATGLAFAGGCLAPALFFSPLLWPRKAIFAGAVAFLAGLAYAAVTLQFFALDLPNRELVVWVAVGQMALMMLGGASLVALALSDAWGRRDADSLLLALWVLGTLAFATFVNWTNNGRSNLPMAPALGILIVRRLEIARPGLKLPAPAAAFAASVLVAGLVAVGDYTWANRVRDSARELAAKYARPARTTWFQGHWGFQYYMQDAGATALNFGHDRVRRGEVLVIPANNTGLQLPSDHFAKVEETVLTEAHFPVKTMSPFNGAGFYASNIGLLPFAFGEGSSDLYIVVRARRSFGFQERREEDRTSAPGVGGG